MKTTLKRDILVIVGVMAFVGLAYLAFAKTTPMPLPPSEQSASHGTNDSQMDMSHAMTMLDDIPNDFESLVQNGNNYMDQGNFAVAAELYRRALEIRNVPDVRVDYGACLHGMGLPIRAIETFKQVIIDQPGHTIATFNLGVVYFDQQQLDSARVYFNKYLELEPNGQAIEQAERFLREMGS